HRPNVQASPLLDGLRRIKAHLLQRRLNTSIGEHWRERLRELDCSRTRLRLARELGFHFTMPLQKEGLSFLRQLGEGRLVFSAPVLGDLIASRLRGWIGFGSTGLRNFWLLRGWIGERGALDCFTRLSPR